VPPVPRWATPSSAGRRHGGGGVARLLHRLLAPVACFLPGAAARTSPSAMPEDRGWVSSFASQSEEPVFQALPWCALEAARSPHTISFAASSPPTWITGATRFPSGAHSGLEINHDRRAFMRDLVGR